MLNQPIVSRHLLCPLFSYHSLSYHPPFCACLDYDHFAMSASDLSPALLPLLPILLSVGSIAVVQAYISGCCSPACVSTTSTLLQSTVAWREFCVSYFPLSAVQWHEHCCCHCCHCCCCSASISHQQSCPPNTCATYSL